VGRATAWARHGFKGLSRVEPPATLPDRWRLELGLGFGTAFSSTRRLDGLATDRGCCRDVALPFPGLFCAVRWPYPISTLCTR